MTDHNYCIDLELSDGGKLITADQAGDFVIQHLVRKQEALIRTLVSRQICFEHYQFPKVEAVENESGLIVIRVHCCCEEFLKIIDKRFE